MSNIAIIPARGGSKRIPRKNVKDFLGKPIIAYSIEIAKKSGLFSEVIVSTDDEGIAAIARNYGAVVPFLRSANNSSDSAPLADVIDEVRDIYQGRHIEYDNICLLFATAPLITIRNLKLGFDKLHEKDVEFIGPVVPFSYPIQRAIKINNKSEVEMFYPEYREYRSQDLEVAFHDAGQFYWMKYDTGMRSSIKYGFRISPLDAQDIDNQDDWILAEMKYKLNRDKEK
jgi:pseudaminic acid cytidylyltransferase